MGLDTGFKLRIKNGLEDKNIKTVEQYKQSYIDLLFLGRVSETVDDLIQAVSEPKEMICYVGYDNNKPRGSELIFDKVKYEKPELPDTQFIVDQKKLADLINKIKPISRILAKYSDRVQNDLFENLEDKEISKADRTQIKDLLFEIDEYASYEDLFYLAKLQKFFEQFFESEINGDLDSDLKADLIYWRSY